MRFPLIRNSLISLLAGALLCAVGCSHSAKPAPQDTLKSDEEDADADDTKDQAANNTDDVNDKDMPGDNQLGLDDNEKKAPPPPAVDAAAAKSAPTAVMSPGDASEKREVRYVIVDNTAAYSEANDKSETVGAYKAGDPLMVMLQGDWAQIADRHFIKASALSIKIVPRKRANDWKTKEKVSLF